MYESPEFRRFLNRMMSHVLAALLLFGSGQELAEQKKALLDAIGNFNDTKGVDAVLKIAEADSKEAIDALLGACGAVTRTAAPLEKEREKWARIMDANAYDPETKKWKGEYAKYKEAKDHYTDLSAKIARLGSISFAAKRSLAKMRSDAAVKELLARLKNGGDTSARAAIAEALAGSDHPDVRPALVAQLKRERDAGVRVALIDAVRLQKAWEAVELLCASLKDEYWQVKVAAAQALRESKSVDAIEPLIAALKGADGRVREELNLALVGITGVDKHGDEAAWRSWWERNREAFLAGTYRAEAAERAKASGGTTFYGIPVTSKHVVFVLDRSGSMAEPSKWKPDDVATGAGASSVPPPKGNRKIDIAKYELKKVLAMLPDGTEFNVIFYNHLVEPMSETLIVLNKETRRRAYEFIDPIEPSGATNISDSLFKALTFSGPADKLSKSGVDTVYLLSDGMPTAGITDTQEILEKMQTANQLRKVAVHAIAIEPSDDSERFMKRLARENHGSYAKK